MVDLAEVNSSVAVDTVAKRQPDRPAGASVDTSIDASPKPTNLAVNDDVAISVEGQRVADALADRLDANDTAASIAPAKITNDQTDADRASQLHVSAGDSAIEDRVTERNAASNGTVQTDTTVPANATGESFPASNQRASVANEQAGNDDLSQTEASRTLGQVIDVFA